MCISNPDSLESIADGMTSSLALESAKADYEACIEECKD